MRHRVAAAVLTVAALAASGIALGAWRADDVIVLTEPPSRLRVADLEVEPATTTEPSVAPPDSATAPPPSVDVSTAPFSQLFDGVLRIRAIEPGSLSVGTAFAVGDGSWALTNRHVVAGADRLELETWDGRSVGTATLVGTAAGGQDLALLRLDEGVVPALRLRADEPASVEDVVTAGYPEGRRLVRRVGKVEGRARSGGAPVLVTDLPCVPGCSGSPVLDDAARVVGVIVGGTAAGKTIAIPIEEAGALLRAHAVTG